VGEVSDRAVDRAEALCGEVQRLLVGLGLMSPPKRRRYWVAVGVVALLVTGVAVVTASGSGRVFPMED